MYKSDEQHQSACLNREKITKLTPLYKNGMWERLGKNSGSCRYNVCRGPYGFTSLFYLFFTVSYMALFLNPEAPL